MHVLKVIEGLFKPVTAPMLNGIASRHQVTEPTPSCQIEYCSVFAMERVYEYQPCLEERDQSLDFHGSCERNPGPGVDWSDGKLSAQHAITRRVRIAGIATANTGSIGGVCYSARPHPVRRVGSAVALADVHIPLHQNSDASFPSSLERTQHGLTNHQTPTDQLPGHRVR